MFPQREWLVVLAIGGALIAMLLPMVPRAVRAESPRAFLENGVTAHRGYSTMYPENTLRAFQAGIDAGADWLECDVYQTRDGQLVVIHDRTTGRVGNRDLCVNEATYSELQEVDVAYAFRRERQLSLAACPAERIPLLEEVIAMVKRQAKTRLSIQPKDDSTAAAVALVERMEAVPWIGFNDGSLARMSLVKQLNPAIPVFWDRNPKTAIDQDVAVACKKGFETVVLHHTSVTAAAIVHIHRAGLKAGAWTINDAAEMRRLLFLGIDRIYTDDPGLLLSLRPSAN